MVVAQLEAAVQPYAPLIAVAVIALVLYFEARGAAGRWGTTNRRSGTGAAISLALIGVVGVGLVLEGWATFGAVILPVVLVVFLAWGLSEKNKRWG